MKLKEKPKVKIMKRVKKSAVKKKIVKQQPELESMTVDDFLSGGFEDIDENSSAGLEQVAKQGEKRKKQVEDDESSSDDEEVRHVKDLEKLKEVDPEFFQFLEENDKELLDFGDVSDDDDDNNQEEDGGKIHRPPEKLEVASDESDFELDEDDKPKRGDRVVTLKKVDSWSDDLRKNRSVKTLKEVLEAFEAALQCVVAEDERTPCKFEVEGAAVFNAVLRLCVMEVQPTLKSVLNLTNKKMSPVKAKNWTKVRGSVRTYLMNLTRLCQVTSPGMLSVLLKHVHQMTPYAVCFPNISSKFLTRLVGLWTSEDDVVRVLAFLCLLRIANLKRPLLSHILKKMYLAFVRNCKFVSPSTLPGINFLRQSLAEMFALDPNLAYHHAFLYIRQLSIHLRNAVTLKKKESFQAVYNWQYIQSLQLWADLFGIVSDDSPLGGLMYPLVQITIGTVKLIPSAQYYPLRFHCVKFLLMLMEKRSVFIPVLPLLLEVLKDFDFNKKHSKVSMKPMDLSCILRCSKLQMQENGFKDAIIESLCALLLEAFAAEAYRVSFPDTSVPAVIQLKNFLKICKNSKYSKQVKAIVDKVVENSKFVEIERSKTVIRLDDAKSIAATENVIRAKSTPLGKYFENWRKIHLQQQAKKITDNEKIGDFKLPTLIKLNKKQAEERDGPVELFPSDDDDSDDPTVLFDEKSDKNEAEPKKKKKKKRVMKEKEPKIKVPVEWADIDAGDIIEELNISDLE